MKIIPFYSNSGYRELSNLYPTQFKVNDIIYDSVEMFVMYHKAKLFKDTESMQKILNYSKLKNKKTIEYKKFGRGVKGFNQEIWDGKKDMLFALGMYYKFSQNGNLKRILHSTGNNILCEANPYDRLYGVGLEANDKRIFDKKNWKGKNLCGAILMVVRAGMFDLELPDEEYLSELVKYDKEYRKKIKTADKLLYLIKTLESEE